jgi:hypothetical protein
MHSFLSLTLLAVAPLPSPSVARDELALVASAAVQQKTICGVTRAGSKSDLVTLISSLPPDGVDQDNVAAWATFARTSDTIYGADTSAIQLFWSVLFSFQVPVPVLDSERGPLPSPRFQSPFLSYFLIPLGLIQCTYYVGILSVHYFQCIF